MSLSIPLEILALVFGSLSLGDLASTSTVCRIWQAASFPVLYRTMHICESKQLDTLRTRLKTRHVSRALSVPAHLKGLVFDCHRGELIFEEDLYKLDDIIPKLTRLDYFAWKMNFMPYSLPYTLYKASIKSVHLESTFREDPDDEWYKEIGQLLRFRGLTHLFFQTNDLSPGINKRYVDYFSDSIENSPTLESIELNLFNKFYRTEDYSVAQLLGGLSETFRAPRLHTFRLLGDVGLEWPECISSPHPLHSFLTRHTRIRDLALGRKHYYRPRKALSPEVLSQLLPSLRHFTGPLFFCEALLSSSLSAQLESLCIVYEGPNKGAFERISGLCGEINPPRLHKIKLWTRVTHDLGTIAIQNLVKGLPALDDFGFWHGVEHYGQFISVIANANRLCKLTLDPNRILQCARDSGPGTISKWEDVIADLVKACSRLELVVCQEREGTPTHWRVLQQGHSPPSAVQIDSI